MKVDMSEATTPSIRLVVEMLPDGRVTVSGPIDNKLLCYGLLESAKDAIREFQLNQKLIQPVALVPRLGPNGR